LLLKSDCSARQNRAQRLAEPKERPPGKTEDEDELEDDYDWGKCTCDPFQDPELETTDFAGSTD